MGKAQEMRRCAKCWSLVKIGRLCASEKCRAAARPALQEWPLVGHSAPFDTALAHMQAWPGRIRYGAQMAPKGVPIEYEWRAGQLSYLHGKEWVVSSESKSNQSARITATWTRIS